MKEASPPALIAPTIPDVEATPHTPATGPRASAPPALAGLSRVGVCRHGRAALPGRDSVEQERLEAGLQHRTDSRHRRFSWEYRQSPNQAHETIYRADARGGDIGPFVAVHSAVRLGILPPRHV